MINSLWNILVIEDNPGDFYLIREYLTEAHQVYEVFNSKTLAEAREVTKLIRFDVILLDLSLPDGEGKALIEDVLAICGSTPIIILTGLTDKQFGIESLKLGVQDYLVKGEVNAPILFKSINYSIERSKAREQLIESNKRYELVSNATNDMVWDWDLETGKIYRSKAGWKKIFGNESADDLDKADAFSARIHPEDKPGTDKFLKRFFNDPSSVTFEHEFRMRRDDGTYAYVVDKGYLIRNELGEPKRLIGALHDITKRKLSEIEVAHKEQRFRSLVQSGTDIICILDIEGHYTFVSPSVKTVLGYDEDDVLGKTVFSFVHPDDLQQVTSEVYQLEHKKFVEMQPFRFPNAAGEWRWLECTATNLLSEPAVSGIVVNSRDITERILQEKEKEQLIRELTHNIQDLKQFSFITSHNLRAPLSNMQGILSILDTSEVKNEETLMLINGLKVSTRQLTETIGDLVEILIIKQNTNLDKEKINFNDTLQAVTHTLGGILDKVQPVVSADFRKAPFVFFNKSYLESIFLNMITNAIKYKQKERPLKLNIESWDEENYVVLSFADNGQGIDLSKYRQRIFGLYQRFHAHEDGKGIGLYMVHSQLTSLGGKIEVESEVDKGTCFKLFFKKEQLNVK